MNSSPFSVRATQTKDMACDVHDFLCLAAMAQCDLDVVDGLMYKVGVVDVTINLYTLLEQLSVHFYIILYIVGALFYALLEHFDIHCWNNYLYAYTQFYTLLVRNSIYCWDTILYIVGIVVCTFLHNGVHCYNTILYIVGAHFYLMLEQISIHCSNNMHCWKTSIHCWMTFLSMQLTLISKIVFYSY